MSIEMIPLRLRPLVEFLESLTGRAPMEKLGELLSKVDITPPDLATFADFGKQTYRRNLICENDWYELLCICWKSGQRSPIHNHAGSTCGLRIIEGVATETVFETTDCGQIKATKSTDYTVGHYCTTQDEEIHQVSNLQASGKNLMTLHIYSPPLRTMDTFSLLTGDKDKYTPTNIVYCHVADGI